MKLTYRTVELVEAEQFFVDVFPLPENVYLNEAGNAMLPTLEADHVLRDGDYICTGVDGVQRNVDRDIFEKTYTLATQPHFVFPPKDQTRPTNEQGIFNKFFVSRVDESDLPGRKHANCEYFVLDLHHDEFARHALLVYADMCKHELPQLAADLYKKVDQLCRRFN